MTKEDFRIYFNANFAGVDGLIESVLTPIFGDFTSKTLTDMVPIYGNGGANIDQIYEYGSYQVDGSDVSVWEIVLSNNCHISQARKNIQRVVCQLLGNYSGAFIVFHYANDSTNADANTWRLSWMKKEGTQAGATSKRYTYLCGPAYSCRTIAERFDVLQKTANKTLDSITAAFDVEALSDEFFYNFRALYSKIQSEGEKGKSKYKRYKKLSDIPENELGFCDFIERYKEDNKYFASDFAKWDSKVLRDYIKKMMGRLVFLQFLQKKGWMCGNPNYIKSLFEKFVEENNENVSDTRPGSFLDKVLEPLFFGVLNTKAKDREELFKNKKWNLDLLNEWKDIPYLNGGLFEQEVYDKPKSAFPNVLFNELFTLFSEYNFTIDENDPDDKEVGIDPEMLSKIFESQLEDNKDKGAFYTPKEIVEYMCKESLIAYLQTDISDEGQKENIRSFVCDRGVALQDGLKRRVAEKLKNVKICDPAIGSGAFPMGMLNLLVSTREKIESVQNRLELKNEIICNNLYGVDIEKGAVDIARLRFWLSLVIDEEKPAALPNLDYKIMQGNSLLEQYEGVDLSGMSLNEQAKSKAKKGQSWQQTLVFDEQGALDNIQNAIRESFATEDHEKKNELRKIINENIKNYIYNLKGCTPEIQQKLADLPIPNDQFFLWHIYFKEVFDKGGFDIVIGNPPYIDSETMVKVMPKERELYAKKFACASGNWDMFIVFMELGISLLKKKGIFSNIIPNKLIAAKYGVELRKYLSARHVLEIRDYSRIDVFEDAAVYPVTIIMRNCDDKDKTLFTIMDNRADVKQSNKANSIDLARNDYWDPFFKDSVIFKLISKINSFSPLKDLGVEVLGAATVADAYEIKKIVQESNSKYGFKLVNSGTIDPYLSYWGIKPCRYIKGSYTYPIVPFGDLKEYSEVRFGQASSPKIIVASMTTRYEAYLDVNGEYIAGKSTTIILGDINNLYKLTAVINSKLASYWLNIVFNSLKMAGGAINIGRNELQILPIPNKDVNFAPLVTKIMGSKASSSLNRPTDEEHEIDRLVYELYGLTNGEVKIIDPNETTVGSDDDLFKA